MSQGSILVLNGVNLGALGERRPEIYGGSSLGSIEEWLRGEFPGVELDFRQTDYEGEFVAWIREAVQEEVSGLIVNPGAWTHYSYAIHDALEAVKLPKVEVHISNVHRREGWRRQSVISPAVDAVVAGMGHHGYTAAISYILSVRRES